VLVKGRESVIKFGTYNYVPADIGDCGQECYMGEISSVFYPDDEMCFVPTQLNVDELLDSLSKQNVVDDIVSSSK